MRQSCGLSRRKRDAGSILRLKRAASRRCATLEALLAGLARRRYHGTHVDPSLPKPYPKVASGERLGPLALSGCPCVPVERARRFYGFPATSGGHPHIRGAQPNPSDRGALHCSLLLVPRIPCRVEGMAWPRLPFGAVLLAHRARCALFRQHELPPSLVRPNAASRRAPAQHQQRYHWIHPFQTRLGAAHRHPSQPSSLVVSVRRKILSPFLAHNATPLGARNHRLRGTPAAHCLPHGSAVQPWASGVGIGRWHCRAG